MPWCVFLGRIAQLVRAWSRLEVVFSIVSVLCREKNVPQVTVSSLVSHYPGSYLTNVFTHIVTQLFMHEIIYLPSQTSTHVTKDYAQQKRRRCCRDESGMHHTQAVGSLVNCHWPQMVPAQGGRVWWSGRPVLDRGQQKRGNQGFLLGLWLSRVQRLTLQYYKSVFCNFPIIGAEQERDADARGRESNLEPLLTNERMNDTREEDSWVTVSSFSSCLSPVGTPRAYKESPCSNLI